MDFINKATPSPNFTFEDISNLPDNYFTYVDLQDGPKQFNIPPGKNGYYDIHFAGGTAPVVGIVNPGAKNVKISVKNSVLRVYGSKLSLRLFHYNTTAKVGYKAW